MVHYRLLQNVTDDFINAMSFFGSIYIHNYKPSIFPLSFEQFCFCHNARPRARWHERYFHARLATRSFEGARGSGHFSQRFSQRLPNRNGPKKLRMVGWVMRSRWRSVGKNHRRGDVKRDTWPILDPKLAQFKLASTNLCAKRKHTRKLCSSWWFHLWFLYSAC